jgi:hypothetical protein
MMYADLIDLDDFTDRLREQGVALPAGADTQLIALELEAWLDDASDAEKNAVEKLFGELAQEPGLMLPTVAALVHRGRACMVRHKIDAIRAG